MKDYLRVVTKQNTFKIDVNSSMDQNGSLILFDVDGTIELVVQSEDFCFCEIIKMDEQP